jgi:hypothetical protein
MTNDKSVSVLLYAVRLKGREGWYVDEVEGLGMRDVEKHIAANAWDILEIRQISREIRRTRQGEEPAGLTFDYLLARMSGWTYDLAANCWRAPDEPIQMPDGNPTPVEQITVAFTPPVAGWLRFEIRVDGSVSRIHASDVFDPFPSLVLWLEQLLREKYTRLSIDEEGHYHELMVFPVAKDRVRFISVSEGADLSTEIDVLIDPAELVQTLYCGLETCFRLKTANPRQWEWEGATFEDMRSPVVEAWISAKSH